MRIVIISIFWILGIAYIIMSFLWLVDKKKKTFIFTSFFFLFIAVLFALGTYFIRVVYREIDDFSKEMVVYTTNLIALNYVEIEESSKLGMIEDEDDIEGHILAKKLMEREKLDNEIIYYDDYYEMISDLYEGEIEGLFVSANFRILFGNEDAFETIGEDVYIVAELSEERENVDQGLGTNRALSEPFSLLIMGVDAVAEGRLAANGDTLIVITFNPKTMSATMLSLPRDLYVPIACRNNAMAKINSSAGRGTRCVINTIEQLTDIKIDYYITLNFRGMVDLVNAIGTIEVDVETPHFNMNKGHNCRGQICEQDSRDRWGTHTVFIEPGVQRLNGEQALAYARNRYQFRDSDLARNRHQQQIIEAIMQEVVKIRNFDTIRNILNTIQRNMDTNLSVNSILSFYSVGRDMLNRGGDISMQRTHLEVYGLQVFLPGIRRYTSALGFHQRSLDEIINAMKVNLELEKPTLIKTFSYSFDEEFEPRPYGQGLRGGSRTETLPNFVGQSRAQVEAWFRSRGAGVTYSDVNQGDPLFNSDFPTGRVVGQSVHAGVLASEVRNITIYVIRNTAVPAVPNPPNVPNNPETTPDNPDCGLDELLCP